MLIYDADVLSRTSKMTKALKKEEAIRQRMSDERARKAEGRHQRQATTQQHMRDKYGLSSGPNASEGDKASTCGWMLKRGKVNKAFKRRWFRLEGLSVSYYESPEAEEPKGSIDISFGTTMELVEVEQQHELHIKSAQGRTFVIRSESNFLRHLVEWRDAIQAQQLKLKFT